MNNFTPNNIENQGQPVTSKDKNTSLETNSRLAYYPPATIKELRSQGAHFVHCRGTTFSAEATKTDKSPVRGWSWRRRRSLAATIAHVERGGLIGIVPASLGLSVLDVDQGDCWELQTLYPPLAAIPSNKPGRWHLYYHDTEARGNYKWEALGAGGEIRSGNGYVVLWERGADSLLKALRLPRNGSKEFPVEAFLLSQEIPDEEPPAERKPQAATTDIRQIARPAQAARTPSAPRITVPAGERRTVKNLEELDHIEEGERNIGLFDVVRFHCYAQSRGGGDGVALQRWHYQVRDFAREANTRFPDPLEVQEVMATATSVSTWTWQHPEAGRQGQDQGYDHSPDHQRFAQACMTASRREARADQNAEIISLWQSGTSIWDIARMESFGSRGRVRNVIDRYRAGLDIEGRHLFHTGPPERTEPPQEPISAPAGPPPPPQAQESPEIEPVSNSVAVLERPEPAPAPPVQASRLVECAYCLWVQEEDPDGGGCGFCRQPYPT